MNTIRVLSPYRWFGQWVFDDDDLGLRREAFISGMDDIIDKLVENVPYASMGFTLLFSETPFPGHTEELVLVGEELGGNWYAHDRLKMEGWLCPSLFKYFSEAPTTIYIQIKA